MSWQTPRLCCQASAAVVCTPVTPDMYSTSLWIQSQMARAADSGSGAAPASSRARSATSSGGEVSRVCTVLSTFCTVRSTRSARASQLTVPAVEGRVRSSMRQSEVSDSSRWWASCSNAVTRVP